MFALFKDRRLRPRADAKDRRRAPRERVLLGGKIVYGGGFTADCRIRDLTSMGARLVLPAHAQPPEYFHLIVVREGVAYRASRQWSVVGEAGVAFHDSHDFTRPVPPQIQPLRELWAALGPRQ